MLIRREVLLEPESPEQDLGAGVAPADLGRGDPEDRRVGRDVDAGLEERAQVRLVPNLPDPDRPVRQPRMLVPVGAVRPVAAHRGAGELGELVARLARARGKEMQSGPSHSRPSRSAAQAGEPNRNGSVVSPASALIATASSSDSQSSSSRFDSTAAHGNQIRTESTPASAISSVSCLSIGRCGITPIESPSTAATLPAASPPPPATAATKAMAISPAGAILALPAVTDSSNPRRREEFRHRTRSSLALPGAGVRARERRLRLSRRAPGSDPHLGAVSRDQGDARGARPGRARAAPAPARRAEHDSAAPRPSRPGRVRRRCSGGSRRRTAARCTTRRASSRKRSGRNRSGSRVEVGAGGGRARSPDRP